MPWIQEKAISITIPSLRIEDSLFCFSGTTGIIERRMMLKMVILTGVILALTTMGGCRKQEKEPAAPGRLASERVTAEKSKTPNFNGLIEEYESILAGDPNNFAATIALGNAYFDAGEWKQAIQHYEKALLLDPSNTDVIADVITDMGTCYRNLGMPGRAIAEYERALKIDPTHQNALFNLGIVYGYDRKDYATAIRYWEKLLHISPKHPRADYLLANIAQFKKAMRQQTK
jgi:tetratricopeptide (TPR) repeat protein